MDTTGPLDLRDYLAITWARKWTILLLIGATTAAAAFYSFRQTPLYTSSAEVVVRPATFEASQPANAPGLTNMSTEEQIANSTAVARLADQRLVRQGIEPGATSAALVPDAETIVFTSTSAQPRSARASAQTYAEAYLELRQTKMLNGLDQARAPFENQLGTINAQLRKVAAELAGTNDPGQASVLSTRYSFLLSERSDVTQKLDDFVSPENLDGGQVIQDAALPTSPSSPDHTKDVAIGFIVGLALGVAVAFARERLDERLRGRGELELHSGAPVLAFVPRIRRKQPPPITVADPMSDAAEAYKALRVRLLLAAHEVGFNAVLITSSLAGEGKTSTTANLGVALAIAGKRTVMVSADLRRPALQKYFRSETTAGLTDVIAGRAETREVLVHTDTENLWLLNTGHLMKSTSPLEVLGSEAMRDVIAQLRSFADFLLIDTPPVLTAPDIAALTPLADGVLFVADPSLVDRVMVEQARYELRLMNVPIVGVVVSKFTPRKFRSYGAGYGYYRYAGDGAGHQPAGGPTPAIVRADGRNDPIRD